MPKTKPKSNTLKKGLSKKKGSGYRPWLAVLLIVVVAITGLVALRYSLAGGKRTWTSEDGNEIKRIGVVSEPDSNLQALLGLPQLKRAEVIKANPGQQIFTGPNQNISGVRNGIRVCWLMAGVGGPANVSYIITGNGTPISQGSISLNGVNYEDKCITAGPFSGDTMNISMKLTNNGPSPVWWHKVTVEPWNVGGSTTSTSSTPQTPATLTGETARSTSNTPTVPLPDAQTASQVNSPTGPIAIALPTYGLFSAANNQYKQQDPQIIQVGFKSGADRNLNANQQCVTATQVFKGQNSVNLGCKITKNTPLAIISNQFARPSQTNKKQICVTGKVVYSGSPTQNARLHMWVQPTSGAGYTVDLNLTNQTSKQCSQLIEGKMVSQFSYLNFTTDVDSEKLSYIINSVAVETP